MPPFWTDDAGECLVTLKRREALNSLPIGSNKHLEPHWFWQRLKELDEEILEHKAVLVEEGFKSVESIGLMTDDDCSHFKIPRGHMRQMQFIFKETKGKK